MVPKESFSPEAWLRKGDVDLESARVLLNDAVRHDKSLEKFRDLCEAATEYYLAERYPYEEPVSVSKPELEAQIRQAELLREALRF